MFNLCIDYTYLLVNRVNAIGENSNHSSQLKTELHCASPIPYHVCVSCDVLLFDMLNTLPDYFVRHIALPSF